MAEIVRRRSFGAVLPLGRQASISGSSFIHAPSVSIAPSSFQEEQNARHHKQFKLEQALDAPARSALSMQEGSWSTAVYQARRKRAWTLTEVEMTHWPNSIRKLTQRGDPRLQ